MNEYSLLTTSVPPWSKLSSLGRGGIVVLFEVEECKLLPLARSQDKYHDSNGTGCPQRQTGTWEDEEGRMDH